MPAVTKIKLSFFPQFNAFIAVRPCDARAMREFVSCSDAEIEGGPAWGKETVFFAIQNLDSDYSIEFVK